MLLFFFLNNKYLMILAWILQSIGYYFVLKKINDITSYAIVPFFAEWRISRYLFSRSYNFLKPFIITIIFVVAGFYMNPLRGMGRLLLYVGAIIYFGLLLRIYRRLVAAFDKSKWYYILMFLFPPLFLYLICRTDKFFHGPVFKIGKPYTRIFRILKNAFIVLSSIVEVVAIFIAVSLFSIRTLQPKILANYLLEDVEEKTKNIVSEGKLTTREDVLGDNASIIDTAEHSREYFYPDHTNDKNVVILEYIIGSNLENAGGLASANIKQMKDTTTKGEHLTFVLQIGGSYRWFTEEIEENSNGRYEIKNGKLNLVEKLDSTLCLSEPKSLEDFIKWAKKNYPADRYILVLWDHGGGFSSGFGVDELNRRQDESTMLVSEMAQAIKNSNTKFDIIGFDACLMQTLETALAFEPFADYYIASEESEGGYGWFYTSAFAKLAQDPSIPSLEFAKELIAAYDVYNTALKDGKVDSSATLSVIDLTMIKPIYEELEKLFVASNEAILQNSEYYADISLSASKAYTFINKEQIDLIHYLTILDSLDYKNTICKENSCLMIADKVAASIPYRNSNSADGVHGLALTFPNNAISSYDSVYKQLKQFNMNDQLEFFNNYFSIMAAQDPDSSSSLINEEWYVKGFEDYDTTEAIIDIPLVETEYGYKVDLPEKIKKIISDTQVVVYQKENDTLKYLGKDYVGTSDINGDIIVDMDNRWIHINNALISYEAGQERQVRSGTIYTGTTRAILNGKDEIIINIEWSPTNKDANSYPQGVITGYDFVDEFKSFMSKGNNELKSGDRLNFIFDYYDLQGHFIEHRPSKSTFYITNPDRLVVKDKQLKNCDIVFSGVLTDVYQRQLLTEQIEYHIK